MRNQNLCNLSSALSYLLKSMFTTPDDVLTLILFKFLYCRFFGQKKKKKKKNTLNTLFLFLQNAYECSCSPRTYVVEVVPEHLYIAMMDSLRQQFYPKMRQAGRDRKVSDSHRKGHSCPMCENDLSQMMLSQIKMSVASQ